jgi:hypothetical protein
LLFKSPLPGETQVRLAYESFLGGFLLYLQRTCCICIESQSCLLPLSRRDVKHQRPGGTDTAATATGDEREDGIVKTLMPPACTMSAGRTLRPVWSL